MKKYLKTSDIEWYKQRVTGIVVCVMAAFALLFGRLFYLQIIEGKQLRRLSETNSIRLQGLDPSRGLIFDRNGTLLVENRPSFDLSIILKDAKPLEDTVGKLSRYLQVDATEIWDKIRSSKNATAYKPILLKHDIGRDLLAAIEVHKFDLPGVLVGVRPQRNYIEKQTAAHLIGYLGEINSSELRSGKYKDNRSGDYIGKFGIEKAFERYLHGRRGGRQVEVNANGQVVRVLKTVEAEPGYNLFLTIDRDVQHTAEKMLAGRAGAAVAMDPQTGNVLAMASSPAFDQNAFVSGLSSQQWRELITNPFRPMSNKAIQGEYPPGSTYKIVTAIAGLEEKVIDATTTVHCPGHYRFGDRVFRCWKKGGHGKVDIVKALSESCDVYFYQVGQNLGVDRLAWYAKACGLGSPTGVNLDHESKGLIPTAAWKKRRTGVAWQKGETLSVAIGQGYNLTTPFQLLVMTAAVANGGVLYKPNLMESIRTAGGDIVRQKQPAMTGRLPVSPENLGLVKQGLWEVVNTRNGTAWIARLDYVEICGKTGTAQVVSRKKGETRSDEDLADHLKPHALFVAYAPARNPRIAVSVIVEHGEHGSSAAAPIAREMINTYLAATTIQAASSQEAKQVAGN